MPHCIDIANKKYFMLFQAVENLQLQNHQYQQNQLHIQAIPFNVLSQENYSLLASVF